MTGAPPARPAGPPAGYVDPRGPRFAAGVSSLVLAVTVLTGAIWLLAAQVLVFGWTVAVGPGRGPWGQVFRRLVRPRLDPPLFFEDAAGPRFAQLVGLAVTALGLVLSVVGVAGSVVGSAAVALVAAVLNSAFGICLGCWIYRALLRIRRPAHPAGRA